MNAVTPIITTGLAGESGHWYDKDGKPCYEIRGANGKMRPVTLRDARKLNLRPGVTGIIKCAAAPGLEKWKRDQVLMSALTLPRIDGESLDDFSRRVYADSEAQGRKARERGTEIHAEIEAALHGNYATSFAAPVLDWLHKRFPGTHWHPERSFASPLGYGGKIDLHAPGIVVDFKTKDFGPEDVGTVKGYDEHAMQLVACSQGLGEPMFPVVLLNLFVSTRVPGLIVPVEWPDYEERMRAWSMFTSLLNYWQKLKRAA